MVNEENACRSHILNHCFPTIPNTMMLKTKADIHVFSAIEKKSFYTPHKLCLWWVYCFHVVRACVRVCVRPSRFVFLIS